MNDSPELTQSGDPLRPDAVTLITLGSALVHAEEALSPDGHDLDLEAFRFTLNSPAVQAWLAGMRQLALLPVKRNG